MFTTAFKRQKRRQESVIDVVSSSEEEVPWSDLSGSSDQECVILSSDESEAAAKPANGRRAAAKPANGTTSSASNRRRLNTRFSYKDVSSNSDDFETESDMDEEEGDSAVEEAVCKVCREDDPSTDAQLLLCEDFDSCGTAIHTFCLSPPLHEVLFE